MIEFESLAGRHISSVCEEAVKLSDEKQDSVHFEFNGINVTVSPGDNAEKVAARWDEEYTAAAKAYRESPEYREAEERRKREYEETCAAHMTEAAQTEAELREAKVPWPYTKEQLAEYIESLVNRQHDYGTCVYAMSMAAEATFNYVAHKLGVTGFQSSCADLDFIRRTRHMDGPFMLIKAEDALYPQYDLHGKLEEAITKWQPWLKEEAAKKLNESEFPVHPNVKAHWERLVQ